MINTVILGASGYTGAELLRIVLNHPEVKVKALTADSNAGQKIGAVYPHLSNAGLPDLVRAEEVDFSDVQLVFCCLPHGTTQKVIAALPEHVKIIDLSADFRLHKLDEYQKWYGHEHLAPNLQKTAVYGLTEHHREDIKKSRLVANPGCYPTSILLPLLPLIKMGAIDSAGIIADSKSGISGAGRSAKVPNLFSEMAENVRPYGLGGHRHVAEIEQELSIGAKSNVQITFVPQVVPMSRGMLSNIYINSDKSAEELRKILKEFYSSSPFVLIGDGKNAPETRHVFGTNQCRIDVFEDRIDGRKVIVSVIDNLVKGASGQAVQNMNVMFGFPEEQALKSVAVYP